MDTSLHDMWFHVPFSILLPVQFFTFFQFNKMCNRFFSSTFILILIRHYTTVTYSIKITAFMLTFKSSAIVHKFEFLHVIWSDFTWHKNFFPPFGVIGSDTCQNILPNKKRHSKSSFYSFCVFIGWSADAV